MKFLNSNFLKSWYANKIHQNNNKDIIKALLNEKRIPIKRIVFSKILNQLFNRTNSIEITATSNFNAKTEELILKPFTLWSYKKSLELFITATFSIKKERTPKKYSVMAIRHSKATQNKKYLKTFLNSSRAAVNNSKGKSKNDA